MSNDENQLETTNYYLGESFHKSNSIESFFSNISFVQRLNCSNEEKESLISTIKILIDVVDSVRNYGYLSLSNYSDKITNPVGRHIIKLITKLRIQPIDALKEIILPYLILSNSNGKDLLESILIYECIYDATVRGIESTLIEYKLYAYLGILPDLE